MVFSDECTPCFFISMFNAKLYVCPVFIGRSFVATKTEPDSNDISECPRGDEPSAGMFILQD